MIRSLYRLFTYSPIALIHERRALKDALRNWNGRHLFLFPYLHTGGAEQVHADIVSTVADQQPLVLICGFSRDHAFLSRFPANAKVVEVPRLLNHPFTRKAALREIAARLNATTDAVLFTANTVQFFDLLPSIDRGVSAIHLQHAFLYQPEGNAQHKAWLSHFDRVDRYVFIAEQARDEFARFLRANGKSVANDKLVYIPNKIDRSAEPRPHDRTGILFVGRDSPEKRPELFLRIAAELERRVPGRTIATAAGLPARADTGTVKYRGEVRDPQQMAEVYSAHDILVLTSTREGFPLVVMEAMAHGLVVVATPVGDVPRQLDASMAVITSTIDAEVVVSEMTDAILSLANDPERLMQMKEAAHRKALTSWDPASFRERYRTLLGVISGTARSKSS